METTIGAVVVNDLGRILPNTTRSTMSRCEEDAIAFFGEDTWKKMKLLGCSVRQVEIKVTA